jgi:hemin uptake protein HemP
MNQPESPLPRDNLRADEPAMRQSRSVTSEELMLGATEIRIIHRDDIYRLRITRSGKLILHK